MNNWSAENEQSLRRILIALICFTLAALAFSVLHRHFDNDEYEHLHKAWMMRTGAIPWFDPHALHTPLLPWLVALLMSGTGESPVILLVARMMVLLFSCGSLWLVYRITRELFGSDTQGLLAVLLTAGNFVWIRKAFEIRPDNLMLFFALAAFWFLIRLHREVRWSFVVLAAISAAIAFFCKQNAAVLFLPMALVFVAASGRRNPPLMIAVGAKDLWAAQVQAEVARRTKAEDTKYSNCDDGVSCGDK